MKDGNEELKLVMEPSDNESFDNSQGQLRQGTTKTFSLKTFEWKQTKFRLFCLFFGNVKKYQHRNSRLELFIKCLGYSN